MATRLIIDGYNLLHVTGIVGPAALPSTLERSRNGLLNFLAAALDPPTRKSTTIVFDAMNAPPGLPHTRNHHGMTVLFAPSPDDADTVIENLIRSHNSPRRLTVVSSDHRIQRAARRRRATPVDSEKWYTNIERRRHADDPKQAAPEVKPRAPLSGDEVQRWLVEFGDVGITDDHAAGTVQCDPKSNDHPEQDLPPNKTNWDGFPPGYCDDLLDPDS